MDTDNRMKGGGNHFGHEVSMANEYGEEVSCTGWNARHTRVRKGLVAPSGTRANVNIAEADESDVHFRSSSFPKCP